MRNAQESRSTGVISGGDGHRARTEIMELLAEAGLGQGYGFEWLLDRLTTTETSR